MKYDDNQEIEDHNKILFNNFRKYNFPTTEYAIVSGGPLAIRGIKKTGDVDLVVSDKLWAELSAKHPIKKVDGFDAEIISLDEDTDVISFRNAEDEGQDGNPTNNQQIENAEIIEELSFQSLRDCLWFKKHSDREKDKKDAELVKVYLENHPEELKEIDFPL